jgi:hypothetical protein
MSTVPPSRGRYVFNRVMRAVLALALVWNLALGVFDLSRGHVFGLISLVMVAAVTATMVFQTRVIRRIERQNRPRPDYSAIAAMEREVYGETFRHEGSIASVFLPKDREPSVRLQCRLGHETRVRGMMPPQTCPTCDEQRVTSVRTASGTLSAGPHAIAELSTARAHPDTTEPATLGQYLAWLNGYIKRGGKPTHFYDYPIGRLRFRYAAGGPLIVDSDREFGADGRSVIVARGVTAERTNPAGPFGGWAHTRLYFMDGYRSNDPGIVPVYSNPEFDAIRERFALRNDGHLSNLRWERRS